MEQDMTQGKPLSIILKFTLPLLVGNIFQQFYNMADTIIVGRFVGANALAAVGSTGTVMFLIIGFAQGITAGFTILTSQRYGAKDEKAVRASVANGILLSVLVTILITVVGLSTMKPLLLLMNTPEDIFADAYTYSMLICSGVVACIFYNLFSSLLRAIGNSKVPLFFPCIFRLSECGARSAPDPLLPYGCGRCCNWQPIFHRAFLSVLCLIYIYKNVPVLCPERTQWRLSASDTAYQMRMGIPMALQFSITASGAMVMQAAINLFGSVAVAAFTAASKVQSLVTQGMMSMGQTMASYGGQNYGKGDYHRLEKGVRSALLISVIYSLLAAATVGLFLRPLLSLFFSGDIDIASLMPWAKTYIYMCAVFYIPLSTIFIFRNIMQGCGYSFLPMMGGVAELFARMITALIAMKLVSFPLACFCDPAAWVGAALFTGFSWLSVKKKLRASLLPEDTSSSSEAK